MSKNESEILSKTGTKYGDFLLSVRPNFIVGKHHIAIFRAIDKLMSGEINMLVISMPPRHGKTTSVTQTLPAYLWKTNPQVTQIIVSASRALSISFTEEVTSLLRSIESTKGAFKIAKCTADRITNTVGGSIFSTYLGGAVGHGGHLVIVDDPIPNSSFCDSDKNVQKLHRRFSADIMSRLQPMKNGKIPPVIIISTRWATNDLVGRVLSDYEDGALPGRVLENLAFPAIDENGDPLWPEMMPLDRLNTQKNLLSNADWDSLYMQQPNRLLRQGLNHSDIKRYTALPDEVVFYGASDYALTTEEDNKTKNDSCHIIYAIDGHSNIYIVECWTGKVNSISVIEKQIKMAKKYPLVKWSAEGGLIRRALEPFIRAEMLRENINIGLDFITHLGSKADKLSMVSRVISSGRLHVQTGNPEMIKVIEQVRDYGQKGVGDDIIDTLAVACYAFVGASKIYQPRLVDWYGEYQHDERLGWMS